MEGPRATAKRIPYYEGRSWGGRQNPSRFTLYVGTAARVKTYTLLRANRPRDGRFKRASPAATACERSCPACRRTDDPPAARELLPQLVLSNGKSPRHAKLSKSHKALPSCRWSPARLPKYPVALPRGIRWTPKKGRLTVNPPTEPPLRTAGNDESLPRPAGKALPGHGLTSEPWQPSARLLQSCQRLVRARLGWGEVILPDYKVLAATTVGAGVRRSGRPTPPTWQCRSAGHVERATGANKTAARPRPEQLFSRWSVRSRMVQLSSDLPAVPACWSTLAYARRPFGDRPAHRLEP